MRNKTWTYRFIISSCLLCALYFALAFAGGYEACLQQDEIEIDISDQSYSYAGDSRELSDITDVHCKARGFRPKKHYYITSRLHEKNFYRNAAHSFDYKFFETADKVVQKQSFHTLTYFLRPSYYVFLFLRALF